MHLGIDLGGTKIEIIALDSDSNELYRHRIASPQGDYNQTLDAIVSLVTEAEAELQTTATLGIGIPGALSPETGLIKNANSTWLISHDLKTDLSQLLNRPVYTANDADCFTLSEASDGAASEFNNVFGVILGTGVGGGIVINQQLVTGPNAITGEWGHNPLPWMNSEDSALDCYCGKQGCIETFLSGPGMVKHYQTEHQLALEAPFSAIDMIDLCRQGDEQAISSFSRYVNRLGKALASVINVLDPEVIVLGGGLSNINEIYPLIADQVAAYIFSDQVNTKFVKATHGDSSGVRGAAWLGKSR